MNLWDKKAECFPRYSEKKSKNMQAFFDFFKKEGLDFKDKTLVDAGAGTGRWALQFAKECKLVSAFDPSLKMITKLKEDKEAFGFKNVDISHCSLMDYKLEFEHDFAFMSRCPALDCSAAIEHFLSFAKKRIVITFAKSGENSFNDFVLAKLNLGKKTDYFRPDIVEEYLIKKGISYVKTQIDDEYELFRTYDEAVSSSSWFLQIHNISYDEDKLRAIIPKDGALEQVRSFVKCLIF